MQVENPIAFAGSALTRAFSTGHLHANYAALLLVPWCACMVTTWLCPARSYSSTLYVLHALCRPK